MDVDNIVQALEAPMPFGHSCGHLRNQAADELRKMQEWGLAAERDWRAHWEEQEERLAEAKQLLTKLQWGGLGSYDYDEAHPACMECEGINPEDGYSPQDIKKWHLQIGHRSDCSVGNSIDSFLQAAHPQEKNDA